MRHMRPGRLRSGKGANVTGPVPNNQDEPNDVEAYRHHLLLLKSMHCCRPVVYKGLNQFITCLTANRDGGSISMTVYLAGKPGAIDSSQIQIQHTQPNKGRQHD
jgi:hypothetical protein